MKFTLVAALACVAVSVGALAQTADSSTEVQSARKACRSDAMKLCSGKRGNEARMCLESNSDKISPDCKNALAKLPPPAPKS